MLLFSNIKVRSLALALLTMLVCTAIGDARTSERQNALRECSRAFGSTIDRKQNLFEVNELFVLQAKFDRGGFLSKLEVQPKTLFLETHPEWKQLRGAPRLSWTDFRNLVTRLDSVKPKGRLTEVGKPSPIVTSATRYFTELYERAVLEWGEVGMPAQPDSGIRFFTLRFNVPPLGVHSSRHAT